MFSVDQQHDDSSSPDLIIMIQNPSFKLFFEKFMKNPDVSHHHVTRPRYTKTPGTEAAVGVVVLCICCLCVRFL